MTDDLLTQFRSEVPLPDEATAERIYRRATTGGRNLLARHRRVLAVGVLAAAAIAGGLSAMLGGAAPKPPSAKDPRSTVPGTFGPYASNQFSFNRDGQRLTSIDVTVHDQSYPDATMYLEVLHRDASEPPNVGVAKTERVFEETVPMTATGATGDDAVVSIWSGTLSPSDWTGSCQDGYYVIWTAVYPKGAQVGDDPFHSTTANVHWEESNAWFSCTGS